MPVVMPSSPQYVVKGDIDALRIAIPSPKQWFIIAFLLFWLGCWAFGMVMAGGMLLVTRFSGFGLFVLFWLAIWTPGGGRAITILLWQLTGKEIVEINSQLITIRRTVLGFGIPKEYLGECI